MKFHYCNFIYCLVIIGIIVFISLFFKNKSHKTIAILSIVLITGFILIFKKLLINNVPQVSQSHNIEKEEKIDISDNDIIYLNQYIFKESNNKVCPICLDNLQPNDICKLTICDYHLYHNNCLKEYIRNNYNVCALCNV